MTAHPQTYGRHPVPDMLADINALRRAVRAHDPEAAEAAWDRIEPHIDAAYGWAAAERPTDRAKIPSADSADADCFYQQSKRLFFQVFLAPAVGGAAGAKLPVKLLKSKVNPFRVPALCMAVLYGTCMAVVSDGPDGLPGHGISCLVLSRHDGPCATGTSSHRMPDPLANDA